MRLRHFLIEYSCANFFMQCAKFGRHAFADELTVLVYHNIPANEILSFERQLSFLNEKFNIVAPDIFEHPERYDNIKKNKILVTFDDGFVSQYRVAKTVLEPLNIKALFFVPTGFIDQPDANQARRYASINFFGNKVTPSEIKAEMLPMTWNNISTLVASGHTIGAHTINHCRLTQVENIERLRAEVIDCGDRLQKILDVSITHFAAPYGQIDSFDERAMKIAAERYKFYHTSIRGRNKLNGKPFFVLRDTLAPNEPLSYARFVVNGGLGLLYWRQARPLREIENKIQSNVNYNS